MPMSLRIPLDLQLVEYRALYITESVTDSNVWSISSTISLQHQEEQVEQIAGTSVGISMDSIVWSLQKQDSEISLNSVQFAPQSPQSLSVGY